MEASSWSGAQASPYSPRPGHVAKRIALSTPHPQHPSALSSLLEWQCSLSLCGYLIDVSLSPSIMSSVRVVLHLGRLLGGWVTIVSPLHQVPVTQHKRVCCLWVFSSPISHEDQDLMARGCLEIGFLGNKTLTLFFFL